MGDEKVREAAFIIMRHIGLSNPETIVIAVETQV
jgi:hypothetical protein